MKTHSGLRLSDHMSPLRLSTRLSITHGVLATLVLVLLVVTLQGLLRMLGVITDIRDDLSSLDAEEAIHRSAWAIEVKVRHGRIACSAGKDSASVHATLEASRNELVQRRAGNPDIPQALMVATRGYLELADAAVAGDTCAYLLLPETDALRARLDEELTNTWIDRINYLHENIKRQEELARQIGIRTTAIGLIVALVGAVAALLIARTTARSVTDPIAQLAIEATRVGDGDFRPIPLPNGPREIEELWRDLDVMRQRLLELDHLKIAFLANVSHELRSPLTRVRAALSLLADGTCGALSDQQAKVVTVASRACEREVRIVTALLDMSRLNSGLPLKVDSAEHIDRILGAVMEDERVDATDRGVRVELATEGEVPRVHVDSELVERALANLVRNAVSVSRSGQTVRVVRSQTGSEEANTKLICVDVIDDGPGVPAEVQKAMFRPFAARAIETLDRPAGIGLGLSLAREVARAHGGDLMLVRSGDTGSVFRFQLPVGSLHEPVG